MIAFKLLLLKAYFDKGWSLTNYLKYLIAFGGIFEIIDAVSAIIIAAIYVIFCFFFGFFWYKYGFIETENEINNIYNPFQREMRKKLIKERFK